MSQLNPRFDAPSELLRFTENTYEYDVLHVGVDRWKRVLIAYQPRGGGEVLYDTAENMLSDFDRGLLVWI